MKTRRDIPFEKLAAGASLGLLLTSATWWSAGRSHELMRQGPLAVGHLSGVDLPAADFAPPIASVPAWSRPAAQTAGPGRVGELFTPPAIFPDVVTQSYGVAPPAAAGAGDGPFSGLELLEVRLAPYRLQLVGYVGAPGNYRAVFASPYLPETWLAREGWRHERLGVTLKSFTVGKISPSGADEAPASEFAAVAVLEDEISGELVRLDNRSRRLTDAPLAVLRLEGRAAKSLELREGDMFMNARTLYRVERIRLDPAEVVVVSSEPGSVRSETHVLRAASPGSHRPPSTSGKLSDNSRPERPVTGLVRADPSR